MSISDQFLSEKLLEDYVKTPPSLKEQVITRLAIQLCQRSRLTKYIIQDFDRKFKYKCPVSEWEIRIRHQSSALCESLQLPSLLKASLINRIWLTSIRLFAWNREYRIRFPTTSQIADELLTAADWTAEGRINERMVAERLVRDERLPLTHRYILACIYFIEPFIDLLWNQIRPYWNRMSKFNLKYGQSYLVSLWSYRIMTRGLDIERDNVFWKRVFKAAMREGQRTAVVYCWNRLSDNKKQEIIVKCAFCAFEKYNSVKERWRNNIYKMYRSEYWCSMPTHYSEILYFLVSQMSHEQLAQFFNLLFQLNSFTDYSIDTTFTWLLESPDQIYFMPIITKLWGILPEKFYAKLLSVLSERYRNKKIEEYKYYDYGNLLVELFQKTPKTYHRYIFSNSNWGNIVFNILDKRPFQLKNIEIIENMLRHATVKEKRSVIYSSSGEHIYYYLIKSRSRDMLDLILSNCLPKTEIANFRKKFTLSYVGRRTCFWILTHENGEEYVNSLLNWANFSPEEISEFKPDLIWNVFKKNGFSINSLREINRNYFKLGSQKLGWFTWDPRDAVTTLLEKFDTEGVDRVLEWCLPSEGDRKEYKEQFMNIFKKDNSYCPLNYIPSSGCNLKCLMSKISQFLCWAFPSEEERRNFKLEHFDENFLKEILKRSILHEQWQDVDFFLECFQSSPIKVKQLKKYVMWNINTLYNILDLLKKSDSEAGFHYLKWGLSDSKTVKAFKRKFDKLIRNNKETDSIQQDWNQLIQNRLSDLAINQAEETCRRKRGFQDESYSCKRFKRQ